MRPQRSIVPAIVPSTLVAGRGEDRVTSITRGLAHELGYASMPPRIIADGDAVGAELSRLLAHDAPEVILTSGATGVTPDGLTPEQTAPLMDKQLPGVMEALRARGATKTPLATLSRGVAGVSGNTVVVNLPGSPGAVSDAVEVLRELLPAPVRSNR